ncbi:MAG: nucleotidyl transferase AbiEii/AbiGii toxin family protein [Chitinophagaceae bacterium]
MAATYLHERKDFPDLLNIIEEETGILAFLVEKDYWLMHVLYGLQKQKFDFKLKGGTSLSKAYKIINRFSEDIDIYIKPDPALGINEKSTKDSHVEKRKLFYDQLANDIKIHGIISAKRDTDFDDKYYRSGGIRLLYESFTTPVEGVKEGILLEAGFDTVTPFKPVTISSWAYDKAVTNTKIQIIDNRAIDVPCYHPAYTFVEKLQTIATKYRKEQETGEPNPNFMRQYYDVYCLLNEKMVQDFIKTEDYQIHKKARFPKVDYEIPIAQNEAFILSNEKIKSDFAQRYKATAALYYKGQPFFDEILERIRSFADKL